MRTAAQREADAKYNASERGRARHLRYNRSARGRERVERYEDTPGRILRKMLAADKRSRCGLPCCLCYLAKATQEYLYGLLQHRERERHGVVLRDGNPLRKHWPLAFGAVPAVARASYWAALERTSVRVAGAA
jgi:hypothetical protein